ncbi:MAG: hypothetical protein PHW43_11670 [Syntrophales bacterium]|nr:hypothetical protein [Syntrophales bacterium]
MSRKTKIIIVFFIIAAAITGAGFYLYLGPIIISRGNMLFDDNISSFLASAAKNNRSKKTTALPSSAGAVFNDNFDAVYTVKEAGSIDKSSNSNWWLSSGGYFYSKDGIGSTVLGPLSAIDPWRIAYFISNPLDTDSGYYPQNIFRLVLKSQWQNFTQEAYFKIINDNLSASPNRNASNGLLFFNRYQDAFNLYYTGIRVDGYAVIKKKINGVYYTMAYKQFIYGSVYNKDSNQNLLPKNTWIGLRSQVITNSDGTVDIKLYVDNGKTGNWVLAVQAQDDGKKFNGTPVFNSGYAGMRTDFMDVEFDNYKISEF